MLFFGRRAAPKLMLRAGTAARGQNLALHCARGCRAGTRLSLFVSVSSTFPDFSSFSTGVLRPLSIRFPS